MKGFLNSLAKNFFHFLFAPAKLQEQNQQLDQFLRVEKKPSPQNDLDGWKY